MNTWLAAVELLGVLVPVAIAGEAAEIHWMQNGLFGAKEKTFMADDVSVGVHSLAGIVKKLGELDPWNDDDRYTDTRKKIEELSVLMADEGKETIADEIVDLTQAADTDPRILAAEDFSESFFHDWFVKRAIKEVSDVVDEPLQGLEQLVKVFLDDEQEAIVYQLFSRGRFDYASYPAHPEFPDVDLSGMMKMLKGPPSLQYLFSNKDFALKIIQLVVRAVLTEIGLQLTKNDLDKASNEGKYEAIFLRKTFFGFSHPINALLPLPEHSVDNWESDKELARQFIAGVNPVMITVVHNLSDVSMQMRSYFAKSAEHSLSDLIDSKRLFYVDYKDLSDLNVNPHQAFPLPMNEGMPQNRPRYFHAPMVLLYLDDKGELDILGIQLEREADAKVYTSSNCDRDVWLFAKTCLASADAQIHEWLSHLGKTHLAMEPHVLASWNVLKGRNGEYDKKDHPLYRFIQPLMQDTLLLNWAARQTLASYEKESKGDFISSVGVGQYLQVIQKWWNSYDFFSSSGLDSELASRGFEKDFEMPSYLFREDGLKLWDAYGEFASDFVDEIYVSDYDVAKDLRLQDWATETTSKDKGNVPGFPKTFKTKKILIKTLQTLSWIAGPLHAAINFPQYDFYAYTPNKPLSQRKPMPQSGLGVKREWIFSEAMPKNDATSETVTTARILTMPSEHTIDDLDDAFSVDGKVLDSYKSFKTRLQKIADKLWWRRLKNFWYGEPVYEYLLPENIPASIDI